MNAPQGGNFFDSVPLLLCEGASELLCEGASDERLLNRIFSNRELKAQQVGGTRNLKPVAAYWAHQNQPVFTIRDREFGSLPEAEACYGADYTNRHFTWRRHELENYLIEPRVLVNCFKQLKPYIDSRINLPDTENSARIWLRELALDLLDDQAGRRTAWELHHKLRDNLPSAFSIFQESMIKSREDWEGDLVNEMKRLRNQSGQIEQFTQMTESDILQTYETNLQMFDDSSFLNTDGHLRDFGGHEMVQKIYQDTEINVQGYGLRDFQNDLVESFVNEWNRDQSFLQPNDFAELQAAIRRQIRVLQSN